MWADHYALAFALHEEAIEVEYLTGNLAKAESLIEHALSRLTNAIDRARIYHLQVLVFTIQAKYEPAQAACRDALAGLDVMLPGDGEDYEAVLEAERGRIDAFFRHRSIASAIDLPEMTDPAKQMVLTLVNSTMPAAFLGDRLDVFSVMIAIGINTCLEHGYTSRAPYVFSGWGIVLVARYQAYKQAYEYSELALRIAEKTNNLASKCQASEVHIAHIHHWSRSLATSIPFCTEGFQAGLMSGGVQWSSYLCMFKTYNQSASGKLLRDLMEQEIEEGLAFTDKMKNQMANDVILGAKFATNNLLGQTRGADDFDMTDLSEAQYLARCEENQSGLGLCLYNVFKAQVYYLYGDFDRALTSADTAAEMLAIPSFIAVAELNFYTSLILAACYGRTASDEDRAAYWQRLQDNQAQMRIWADNCDANFEHKFLIVAAEMARISGENEQVIELYQDSITSARDNEFVQNEGIAHECAARYWLERNQPQYAALHLEEAHYCFGLWGAAHKVGMLEAEFPEHFATRTRSRRPSTLTTTRYTSSGSLDLETIFKASRSISSEMELDSLLATLIDISIENAGAEGGCLIVPEGDAWMVVAEGHIDQNQTTSLNRSPVAAPEDALAPQLLSSAVIHYVIRTRDTVVLDDASHSDRFAKLVDDSHARHLSVMCMPLVNQGSVRGILYLENTLTAGAFSADRAEILEMLSSEMAISLDKATLYRDLQAHRENLEALVDERTQELREAQGELVRNERLATLGQVTATVSHELRNPLGTIRSSIFLIRRKSEGDPQLAKAIERAERNVNRCDRIIEELLDFTRASEIRTEPTVVDNWLDSVVAELDLPVGIEVVRSSGLNGARADVDTELLRRALINVIENACHAMAGDPAKQNDGVSGKLTLATGVRDGRIEIAVGDSGAGMSEAVRTRIFEPLFSTKTFGVGLGMPTVNRIMGQHSGGTEVTSEEGSGTRVALWLPLSDAE